MAVFFLLTRIHYRLYKGFVFEAKLARCFNFAINSCLKMSSNRFSYFGVKGLKRVMITSLTPLSLVFCSFSRVYTSCVSVFVLISVMRSTRSVIVYCR